MRDYRAKSQTVAFADRGGYLSAVRKESQTKAHCRELRRNIDKATVNEFQSLLNPFGEKRRE
jgi:hypothetical protein